MPQRINNNNPSHQLRDEANDEEIFDRRDRNLNSVKLVVGDEANANASASANAMMTWDDGPMSARPVAVSGLLPSS